MKRRKYGDDYGNNIDKVVESIIETKDILEEVDCADHSYNEEGIRGVINPIYQHKNRKHQQDRS